MPASPDLSWQPSLFGIEEVGFDRGFRSLGRIQLDERSWVDYAAGWVSGSDRLFEDVLASRDWSQRSRVLYDQTVREPRLTAPWSLASGEPLEPPILEEMRRALSERYGRELDSVGFNLYRDGRDSVAWHGDRIPKEIDDPVVCLVALGEARRFLLRSKEGGASRAFAFGRGDLLVTGGKTQRAWQHSVPKVARAGPRVSLGFRHGMPIEDLETGGDVKD